MFVTRVLFPAALAASLALAAPGLSPDKAAAGRLLGGLPMYFEANQGQWNPRVKFAARTGDGRVFLTARDVVLSFQDGAGSRLATLSLAGANPAAAAEGVGRLSSHSNYFHGNRKQDWHADVAHFNAVRYHGVYPGVDILYYGNQNQLEYDFLLQPGADPSRIRMKLHAAGRLSVTAGGDLVLEDGAARLVQKKPRVTQGDREIAARYTLLAKNMVGVALDSYDRSRPVTIDPVVAYASLLGTTGSDAITAVKADSEGKVYITGNVGVADLTTTSDAYQTTDKGGQEAFLAIVDTKKQGTDSLVSFTYYGGTGDDYATCLTIDSTFVYIAGRTTSSDLPLVNAPQFNLGTITTTDSSTAVSTTANTADVFVARFYPKATGTDQLFFATYFGGDGVDQAAAIGVDAKGSIYVTGTTTSSNLPVTDSGYARVRFGNQDAFIVKFNPDDTTTPKAYASYLGGEVFDEGRAIAVRPDGRVFFAGTTNGWNFPQAGVSYQPTLHGRSDGFIVEMDLTQYREASLLYNTYFGGTGIDEIRAIAFDAKGRLLVTGYTTSTDLPVTGNAAQLRLKGNADAFVAVLDFAHPENVVVYCSYLGGSGGDVAYAVAGDAAGNIYLTGYTLSSNFPVTSDALQSTYGKGTDAFVSKIDASGALAYSTYLGKTGTHIGYSIDVDQKGNLYVGGSTSKDGIQPNGYAFQGAYGGGLSDGFLMVLAQ